MNIMKPVSKVFPEGPHPVLNEQVDIIIVTAEGMFYSFFRPYFADAASVLEMLDGLGDPFAVYNRKVKKGAYCVGILYMCSSHIHLSSGQKSK